MNLADPAVLKPFLAKHGLKAEKGLGQHFLASSEVVDTIVASLEGMAGILEIGPGPGVLTSPLSERCEKMIALELDSRMVGALKASAPKADVRQEDALRADLGAILSSLPEPRAVVSNLPYYITGPLLTKIAETRDLIAKAVLMMQKEVAERVLAGPKTPPRGSLSVFLQSQFDIRFLASAPASVFVPPPKVDSAVLELTPKVVNYDAGEEATFFKLVRMGFAMPRKTLVNNLIAGFAMPRTLAEETIAAARLGPKSRPQELSETEWLTLLRALP